MDSRLDPPRVVVGRMYIDRVVGLRGNQMRKRLNFVSGKTKKATTTNQQTTNKQTNKRKKDRINEAERFH